MPYPQKMIVLGSSPSGMSFCHHGGTVGKGISPRMKETSEGSPQQREQEFSSLQSRGGYTPEPLTYQHTDARLPMTRVKRFVVEKPVCSSLT